MKKAVLVHLMIYGMAGFATTASAKAPDGGNLGFDLRVELTPAAAQELKRRKEGLVISAAYSGMPRASAERHANAIGMIDLGRETLTLPAAGGKARISGAKVDRTRLPWLAGPAMVNVNVFTARRSGPDNLVTCDFIDGEVAKVAAQPTTLVCGLIGESREAVHYPRAPGE